MKAILLTVTAANSMNSEGWYILGAIISVAILVYLVYTLIRPDKF